MASSLTTVVNKRTDQYDVYIGRGSIWGNPFVMGKDGTRDEVVAKYRWYFEHSPSLRSRVHELQGKRLGCFCKPAACHGDVLAEAADATLTEQQRETAMKQPPADSFHVALTGHRPSRLAGYDLAHPFYGRLQSKLQQIIIDGLSVHRHLTLHSGMALGADTVWSMAILRMREQHPDRIHFVAEVPVMTQPDRWPSKLDRDRWAQHLADADLVSVYAQKYHVGCLWARNKGMIDAADLLLAVHDDTSSGGTSGAMDYAKRTGKQVFVLSPDLFR